MTGNDLIPASVAGADDLRLGNPDMLNAVHEPHQIRRRAVNGVWLTGVGKNLRGGDDLNALLPVSFAFCIRFEQGIVPGQFDAA